MKEIIIEAKFYSIVSYETGENVATKIKEDARKLKEEMGKKGLVLRDTQMRNVGSTGLMVIFHFSL